MLTTYDTVLYMQYINMQNSHVTLGKYGTELESVSSAGLTVKTLYGELQKLMTNNIYNCNG